MNGDATGTLTEIAAIDGAHRAVVIGAGMGGLLAARALADHFTQVVVLDRDTLPDSPAYRKNVPQGHHVHGLLARGRVAIERLFPGIGDELVADGALLADSTRDLTWFQQGGYFATPKRGLSVLLQTRPMLEHHVRRRLAMLPNVMIIDGCQVTGLLASRDRHRVTGARVAEGSRPGTEHEIAAALTVDASGRGSRLPQWLEQLGYDVPGQVAAGVEARYTTRLFRRVPGQSDTRLVTVVVASSQNRRGGVAIAQEGNRWLVTLASRGGAQPPTELSAFIDWARSLEVPDIYDIVRQAIPLDDSVIYRFPHSARRHYDRMERFPAGLLPFGDAICSFSPVYAQGMSLAAIEAEQLSHCLATDSGDLARRFFASIAAPVDAAWKLAAAGDLRYMDDAVTLPRSARIVNAYMARVLTAARHDAVVAEAFHNVTNLVDMPQHLMRPSIALRVAWASVRHSSSTTPRPAATELASSPAD